MATKKSQGKEQLLSIEDNNDSLIEDEATASHIEVIETIISSLDQNDTAMVSRNESGGRIWKFQYGTVEVFVQLTGEEDDDTLAVWASVLKLPAKDESRLMRKLLEMNWSDTYEASFAVYNDQVVVLTHRTVADLYPGEISRAITLVASIADDNDEALQEEFGQS
ncbi:YbjN domain-containing protein [Euhalothece natronophila Z-M001]|uniref:YbjN domain-containing protein n=1 Tax=Euhalothece natronophila Z-M001 TaxID=522448 RepID=A0A5B8NNI2_9CHRO|nr:YbjN domain-containing protein [Euhalothece natronophila]QDZ40557.1 YbjN domain-containing protein [Euhalothece natronophila Z-M001]